MRRRLDVVEEDVALVQRTSGCRSGRWIGVRSPEFPFEKNVENLRRAVNDMRVDYPVAIDSEHAIWSAFNNEYWPAIYLVDPFG